MSIIAVDLDGTSYEYHTAYCYMARTYLDVDIRAEDWLTWDYPEEVLTTQEELWWMDNEAPKLGLYRYGHIMKGAIIGIRKLAEKHDVIVITHRPRSAVADTLAWLVYANLPLSGVHILSDGQAKTSVEYDLLIDDRQ
jgi:5'(3')-deoxyribonucleotidase